MSINLSVFQRLLLTLFTAAVVLLCAIPPVSADDVGFTFYYGNFRIFDYNGIYIDQWTEMSTVPMSGYHYELDSSYLWRSFNRMNLNFRDWTLNLTSPVAVFVISGIDARELEYFKLLNCSDLIPIYNIDSVDSLSNDDVYYYAPHMYSVMLFIPVKLLMPVESGQSAYWMGFQIRHSDNYNGLCFTDKDFFLNYVGSTDFSGDYSDLLSMMYAEMQQSNDDILESLNDIKVLLQDNQSSSEAASSMSGSESVHDNIDTYQSDSITSAETGFTSIVSNPDYNLSSSSVLNGASFVGLISSNIFNSVGVFNWMLIFPALIGLGVYLLGRVGVLFK